MFFLLFIKNFWNILLDFANTKLGKIVLCSIAIFICLLCIYRHGYSKGIESEQIKQKILLDNALKEQLKRSEIEREEAVKLAESNKETEKIYIKVKEKTKEIKDKNPQFSSKECSLNKEDLTNFNNGLDEIK